MDARALMQGHVRAGSWFAVAVDLQNDGPPIDGELRISGGLDSRTRFGTPVELATGSRKEYLLYALPPTFGGNMTVELVSGGQVIAKAPVAVALHDQTQLVVGLVAENPARLVGELDLLPNQNGVAPVIVPLSIADLPERVQAWAPLDRLIWQDVDTASLTPGQLSALRTWIAGGGRLVIVGGTASADVLTGLPDDILPYRPTGIVDVDPAVLQPLLGLPPENATTLTAFAGDPGSGRTLATSGDRVIAADMSFGSGSVTLLGFDPATTWIAAGDAIDTPLWRRLLPPRSGGNVALADDQTIVGAVANLPSLALPPIGALLVLLAGYIVLVGPVNYLVLRYLDRREWAWVTVPVLIAVFTVGAFGIGALLRGSDVILNEVAIVRGAPGTDAAVAQSYLGIFSPSRATYQLRVPGDALLASPMNGDMSGGGGTADLDVLQGDPSRVRDLAVGFGSMRTVRAEASTTGPKVSATLELDGGHIRGTVTNTSNRTLLQPAIVLGSSVATLPDLAPGASGEVNLAITANGFNGQALSDEVVGPYDWDGSQITEAQQRKLIRRAVIDQLSFDPTTGISGVLPGDSPTLLAWGNDPVLGAELEGAEIRREANVLYEVPAAVHDQGSQHVQRRPPAQQPPRRQRELLLQGPLEHQLRDRRGHDGLPAAAVRGQLRARTAGARHAVRRQHRVPGWQARHAHRAGALRPAGRRLRRPPGRAAGDRGPRRQDRHLGPVRAHERRPGLRDRERRPLGRPVDGPGPGQVRERAPGRDRVPVHGRDHGDGQMTGIVHAGGLVKRYDRTLAVAGLDLDVAEGEIFGLVGPNGAGKTTTLRILATLLVPDAGDAEIGGFSVRRNPNDVRRVLGFMPDSFGVYDDMKVWEYLDFFARCYGIPADRRRRMIGDLLDLVDLGPKRDTYVQGLSRGMQQRLCLAHALVHDPSVLLLDEPASGLDPRARVELRELLRELRNLGKTILVSSHILPELEELCTSVAIIDRGQVLAHGRVADIERRLRVGAVYPRARARRRRRGHGRPGLVRPAARRRLGPGARRRHDRDRVPRRRRRRRGPARGGRRAPTCGSPRSRAPRATSRSCSSR